MIFMTPSTHTHDSEYSDEPNLNGAGGNRPFLRGVKLGAPVFLGYFPVGMAFGILAHKQGFSFLEAVLCSALALAGAGQFIALAVLAAGGSATTTLIATGIVNLRYVLFAATLSPYLKRIGISKLLWPGYTLTDETFAINVADLRENKATVGSMNGVGLVSWSGWVLGTAVGVPLAGLIGNPNAWGLDFAMPAMFAALFVTLADNRRQIITGAVSAAIVIALAVANRFGLGIDSNLFIVIAALAGATVASVIFSHDETDVELAEIELVAQEAFDE